MKFDPHLAALLRIKESPVRLVSQRTTSPPTLPHQTPPVFWTEELLGKFMATTMAEDQVIIVSNRQPFTHEFVDKQIKLLQPASGLVTALEPVVRACDGVWIAHGNGLYDRDLVDSFDRCPAPVGAGSYQLRRLWLNALEQQGHCDGFANSGLWPLCHSVHVKPVFKQADWDCYRTVNTRFADAVVQEARGSSPVVLVQDYHLALVPQLLRTRLPNATIVSFWHIPWGRPEEMAACPWLPEVLAGLLGSDIAGFQTRQDVQNFMELARRQGKHVSGELPALASSGHTTQARAYPISIAWPVNKESGIKTKTKTKIKTETPTDNSRADQHAQLLACTQWKLVSRGKLIIGVDRFDYTKGLIERLKAFERLLLIHPHLQGVVRFVQIAAPTRTSVKEYRDYRSQVFREVERINCKFRAASDAPVVLLDSHYDRVSLDAFYRSADVCLVCSLHDGMNLVSKEFVAARDDEMGVLVLSQFAGAAHELHRALIVNPHQTVQVAAAMFAALTMSAEEQSARMRALRLQVRYANVYRWAASMLSDAMAVRAGSKQLIGKPVTTSQNLPAHISLQAAA